MDEEELRSYILAFLGEFDECLMNEDETVDTIMEKVHKYVREN